jgi:hypothetical protein
MGDELAKEMPTARVLRATADRMGELADSSVSGVVAAQVSSRKLLIARLPVI